MKILFVAPDPLDLTGSAKISYHLSSFLADQPDVEVYHIAINHNQKKNVACHRRRHPKIKYIDPEIPTSPDIYGPPVINNFLEIIQPDILLIYNDCLVTYRNLQEIDKIPEIRKKVRVILYLDVVQENMKPTMLEFIQTRADDIYVLTDIWTQYFKNSRVLYPWIDPFFSKQNQTECRLRLKLNNPNDFVIVNTNRNTSYNRLDITVRAFLKFYKQVERKNEVKLLLVSSLNSPTGFDLLELIKRECEYENLEQDYGILACNNILHLSQIRDETMNDVYNAGDVGINTTSLEGFGLSNLEMGSLGKPQLVSGVGGLRDIYPSFIEPKIRLYCSEKETGGLLGYKKICLAEDFTKKLLEYYHDRALMEKDGKELASLLHRKYNKDRILEAWWKEVQQH